MNLIANSDFDNNRRQCQKNGEPSVFCKRPINTSAVLQVASYSVMALALRLNECVAITACSRTARKIARNFN